jgi:dipeptidyl aminopeptidase/acylaminoacyl peptidase
MIAASSGGRVITLTETAAHKGVPAEDAAHVAVQPDDEHLTTVSFTGEVAIHSLGEPQRIIVIPSADDEFDLERVEDLSPNGLRYAAAGDPAHQIHLWDLSSSPAPEVPLEGHRGDVLRLSFDSSSDFLASADESEVIIWSAKDRAEVSRIPLPKGYTTTGLAVSPKGRYIATSSSDGQTLLWDTTSNNLASTSLPVEGTTSLTFSPDGRWLSIGSQNEIRLWSLDTGKMDPRRIPIPTSETIQFSPDSTLLAISRRGLNGSEVTVWSVREAQIAGTVSVDAFGSGKFFAFTSDSAWLAVAGQGVFLGPFDAPWALQHVCRITGRNLNREEWNQHAQGFDYTATCP